jgi:hypothetical protein
MVDRLALRQVSLREQFSCLCIVPRISHTHISFTFRRRSITYHCLLTTSKIHSPGKRKYLLFYITHSPICFGFHCVIIMEFTIFKRIKHPGTASAYTCISVVHSTSHIKCKLLWYSIIEGEVKHFTVLYIYIYIYIYIHIYDFRKNHPPNAMCIPTVSCCMMYYKQHNVGRRT